MARKKLSREQEEWLRGVAAAMIDHARTKVITLTHDKYGPIYVRALVPRYAQKDWEQGRYSAFYIGHLDHFYLEQEQVESYVSEFGGDQSHPDWTNDFHDFLGTKGYILFHSSNEDGAIFVGKEG